MGIYIQSCASTQSSIGHFVRLACLRHATSVHPEPGSNSQKNIFFVLFFLYLWIDVLLSFQWSFSSFFCFFFQKAILIYHLLFNLSTLFFVFSTFFIFAYNLMSKYVNYAFLCWYYNIFFFMKNITPFKFSNNYSSNIQNSLFRIRRCFNVIILICQRQHFFKIFIIFFQG